VVLLKQLMSPATHPAAGLQVALFDAARAAGQSVRPAASGAPECPYAPGERRSKVIEAARSYGRRDRVPVVAATAGTRSVAWRSVGEGEDEVEL
jgi:hypothetical protein